jgi:P27 family predicted phage terminase small subunit
MTEPARLLHAQRRPQPPRAPGHLSTESRDLWRRIVADYELERHHLAILERACEALDRLRECQAAIAREGITVEGRFGPRPHPAAPIEAQSRIAFLRAVRELGLDLEAPISRPPTRWRS